MSVATRTAGRADKFKVPWDITEWLDRPGVLARIIEDIDSLDWANSELNRFLQANPNFQPRLLLILISYAYSTGTCESEEVRELWFRDELIRGKVAGQPPGPAAITRFRREHRGLLKWIITQAFKHALRKHSELGDATIPPGLMRALRDAAAARIDVSRHLDRSVQGE